MTDHDPRQPAPQAPDALHAPAAPAAGGAAGADAAARALADGALVAAMRRGEGAAFREFLRRFQPLLAHHARTLGWAPELADDAVADVLGDAALRLAAPGARPPRSLAAYLVAALHNRARNAHRDGDRAARRRAVASEDGPGRDALPALCSEASARATHGPAWEPAPLAPPLDRLARALVDGLEEDERALLAWMAHRVPHRDIARWLGIGHAAATKRAERLRARLRTRARRHLDELDGDEREALLRFFRRAGAGAADVVSLADDRRAPRGAGVPGREDPLHA